MPKRLPSRWRPECIRECRASARERFDDGLVLAGAGRRSGAIYLWGYCVEMLLKAAYFSALGLNESDVITMKGHVYPAIQKGKSVYFIAWPLAGQGHNIRAWAELLLAERSASAMPYPSPLSLQIQRHGQQIGQLWSEQLRYDKNVAYLHEVSQVREAAEWFLTNFDRL